ncbi:MAG: hypothetical protein LBH95_10460 [Oscillospiraceae bacterium]|nr:hypothetical protein [Oscillospiraceae bacterium]
MEAAEAADWFTHSMYWHTVANSPLSYSSTVSLLQLSKPIITLAGYYNSSGTRTGGHMVVIIGYGTGTDEGKISYLDPWVGNSGTYTCTYDDFADGTYNERIWESASYVL